MPKQRVLSVAVAVAFGTPAYHAYSQTLAPTALPTGGRVVAGQAAITQSGASMAINQTSARAALDWQTFNIGSQAAVRFNQPSASAIALNRILGNNASEIYGQLSANGQVFLLNPNGILFGQGAQVDVGGLLASTLSMSSDDFMAGRFILKNYSTGGSILNQGTIKAAPKGYVAFVGPTLRNDGTIEAPSGTVSLTAGNAATLDFMADGLVKIRVDEKALESQVVNSGAIRADGGGVFLTATAVDSLARAVVNNTGVIEARTVENVNGVVRLGGGEVTVSGTIDASGGSGSGGSIKVLGDKVALTGRARLDASGDQGGGEVLIGGNYQGKGPEQNASQTFVGRDVTIDASAKSTGDGGRIIVWSNEYTEAHGTITARGGVHGGNGGLIETSGKTLDVTGIRVDAGAPNGKGGEWLLDPINLTISNNPGGPSNVDAATIQSTLNTGTDVTVATSGAGAEAGDITVFGTDDSGGAVAIIKDSGTDATLTLRAAGSIDIHGGVQIISTSGRLNLTLNSANDNGTPTGSGAINILGTTIQTNGGDVVMGGGSSPLTGAATGTSIFGNGVLISGTTITTGAGSVSILGQGFAGGSQRRGVLIDSGSRITVDGGNVTIGGTGGAGGATEVGNEGVRIESATVESLSASGGFVEITGTGGAVGNNHNGVRVASAAVTSVGANLSIDGTGGGDSSAIAGAGVFIDGNSTIESSGAGSIDIEGTGGPGTLSNFGILLQNSTVRSTPGGSGAISLTGAATGSGGANDGIRLEGGTVTSLGSSAALSLSGTGSGTEGYGVLMLSGMTPSQISGGSFLSLDGAGSNAYSIWSQAANTISAGSISVSASGHVHFDAGLTTLEGGTDTSITVVAGSIGANGPISTGNALSTGFAHAVSSVFIQASGNVSTGDITTGDATSTATGAFEVPPSADSSVSVSGLNIVTGAIRTGLAASSSSDAASWVWLSSRNALTVNGNISTGHSSAATMADSGVYLEGGFDSLSTVHVVGGIQTGNAMSIFDTAWSEIYVDHRGPVTIDGDMVTGTASGASAYSDAGVFTEGNVTLGGGVTTGAATAASGEAMSKVDVQTSGEGVISVAGPVGTGAADSVGRSWTADSSVQLITDATVSTSSISTGLASGSSATTSIAITGSAGATVVGTAMTGNATANGAPANSNVNVAATGGAVATGSITTGLATSPDGQGTSNVSLHAGGGDLSVAGSVATGTTLGSAGGSGDSTVSLTASGNVGVSDITTGASSAGSASSGIQIASDSGDVIAGNLTTGALTAGIGGNSAVQITAPGSVTVGDVTTSDAIGFLGGDASIQITAGDVSTASLSAGASGSIGNPTSTLSLVQITSAGTVNVNGDVSVTGANGGVEIGAEGLIDVSGGNAQVQITALSDITTQGTITVTGGSGGTVDNQAGSGSAIASGGNASLIIDTANGQVAINNAVTVTGGSAGSATAQGGAATAHGGSVDVSIGSGSGTVTTSAPVLGIGGGGGTATATISGNSFASGGSATVGVGSSGDAVGVHGGLGASGGAAGSATTADGGNAFALVSTPFGLTVGAGGVDAMGGNAPSGKSGSGKIVLAHEIEPLTFGAAGDIQIFGDVDAQGGGGSQGGAAAVMINGGTLASGSAMIRAASGAGTGAHQAHVSLTANGISLSAGSVIASGGVGAGVDDALIEITSAADVDVGSAAIAATGRNARVNIDAGNNAALGSISATGTGTGKAAVVVDAVSDININATISTQGAGTIDEQPAGIYLTAGNAISNGPGGLLSARRPDPGGDVYVELEAQNGIGTLITPIRIQDFNTVPPTGPVVNARNLGSAGDLAISLDAAGETVSIDDGFTGFVNNNPNGTYLFQVENGHFVLNANFAPATPLSGHQSVVLATPQGGITLGATGAVQTPGLGTITLTANNPSGAGITLMGGSLVSSQSGAILLDGTSAGGAGVSVGGTVQSIDGTITVTGNAVSPTPAAAIAVNTGGVVRTTGSGSLVFNATNDGAGAAVFLDAGSSLVMSGTGDAFITGLAAGGAGVLANGTINADIGSVTIFGTAGTVTDGSPVPGVGNNFASTPMIHAGNSVIINGQGGNTNGTSSAAGVAFGNASIIGTQVQITGTGGSSTLGGAAGVIFTSPTSDSEISADAGLTITGIGGSAGGTPGGSAIGVLLGSSLDVGTTHVNTPGTISIHGTGGTGTDVGANGVAINRSLIQSLGGINIGGNAGETTSTVSTSNASAAGVSILTSTIEAADLGNISINGFGGTSSGTGTASGVGLGDGSVVRTGAIDVEGTLHSGSGSINITGVGGDATGSGASNGVGLGNFNTLNGAAIRTDSGSVSIFGDAGNAAGGEARGFVMRSGSGGSISEVVSFAGGGIDITGLGGASATTGTNSVTGVGIGAGSIVRTSGGISLSGTGGINTGTGNAIGVGVSDNSRVEALGSGWVMLDGTGGNASGGGFAHGVSVSPFTTTTSGLVVSDAGSIAMNGAAGTSPTAKAVNLQSTVTHSNSGTVSITGTGDILLTDATVEAAALTLGASGSTQIAGTTVFQTATPFHNSAALDIMAGATLITAGRDVVNNGFIGGSGTLDLGSGTLTNNGTVQPGGAATVGTLIIAGNYVQGAGGTLDVDLASAVSGDLLAVSGTAALDGTLSVNLLGGYTPALTHNVLTYASQTGTFAQIVSAPAFPFTGTYGSTFFTLGLSSDNTWISLVGGDWNLGSNWSLGHAPTSTETAQVPDLAGSETITLASGAQAPRSVVFVGDERFFLTGGSLTLTESSSLANGTFELAGATVTANADLSVKHFVLSSGVLNGSGNVRVTDSYLHSGGTFDITGLASITQLAGNLDLGTLSANALRATALSGAITGNTLVNTLSAHGANGVTLTKNGPGSLTIATVDGQSGVSATGGAVSIALSGSDAVLVNESSITGTGGVTLTADKMALQPGSSVDAGSGLAVLQPNNPAGNVHVGSATDAQAGTLELSSAELATVSAGTLQVKGANIDWTTSLGGTGSEFAASLDLRAANNITISNATLLLADGASFTAVADNDSSGAGDLSIINSPASGGHRTVLVGTSDSNSASMFLDGHNVNVRDSGGTSMTVILRGTGTQTVNATAGLVVEGGSLQASQGTQNITAPSITVGGGGTFGRIEGRTQTLAADHILVRGGDGIGNNAGIQQTGLGGSQTIQMGAGGTLTIAAGNGAGGNNFAEISSQGDQEVSFASGGVLHVIAGVGGANNSAHLFSNGASQSVAAQHILIQGGSGANTRAMIGKFGPGTQTIDIAPAGSVTLQGGIDPAGMTFTQIFSSGTSQDITFGAGGTLTINGGSGNGNNASVVTQTGSQSITVDNIVIRGGSAGGNNMGQIGQFDPAGTQSITITNGGAIALMAGNGAAGLNDAQISSQGPSQHIAFASGGTLQITGGSGGVDNLAVVETNSGTLTISGGPAISLIGGTAGGSPDQPNSAEIFSEFGAINIAASSISLTGGAGVEAGALITGSSLNVTSTGAVTIQGGTGVGAVAGFVNNETATTITLSAPSLTLTGGAGGLGSHGFNADAVIGAKDFDANVTLNIAGSVSATRGASSGSGSFIGSDIGGGSVAITAGTMSLESTIRTDTLTTSSAAGTTLSGPNAVLAFSATNGGPGGVTLTNTASVLDITGINGGSGAVLVNNTGSVNLAGSVGGAGNTTIVATGDIVQSAGTVSGVNVTLSAGQGIGVGKAVQTSSTGILSVVSGAAGSAGDITVNEANGLDTARLIINTNTDSGQTVSVSAPSVVVGGNLDLSVFGTDHLVLTATAGNIDGGGGRLSSSGGITLTGNNIGSAAAPVLTNGGTGTIVLNPAASGGVAYISNNYVGGMFGPGGTQIDSDLAGFTDAHTLSVQQTAGNITIADEGIILDQDFGTGQTGTLQLDATAGSIVYVPGSNGPIVHARNVVLHASGSIGAPGASVLVNAEKLTAKADTGGVNVELNPNRPWISTSPGVALVQRVYANGSLQDQVLGVTTISNAGATGYTLAATGDLLIAGNVGLAGAPITLVSTGNITGSGLVSGSNVTLDSVTGVGTGTAGRVNTAADTLAARAAVSGGVFVAEADSVTLVGSNTVPSGNTYDLSAGGAITLQGTTSADTLVLASPGAISNSAGATVSVTNNARITGGSIDFGNQSGDSVNFGSLTYNSAGQVSVAEDSATLVTGSNTALGLALSSAGSITDAPATSQSITNHATFSGTTVTLADGASDVLSVGGTAAFNAGVVSIPAAGTANFGALGFTSPGTVAITEDSDTILAGVSTAGGLVLGSAGAISNAPSASLTVTGNAAFNGTSIDLGNQSADVVRSGSLTYNSAGAVSIAQDSATLVSGTNSASSLVLSSTGALGDASATSQTISGNATFTGLGVTLADNASDVLSVGGTASFNATGGGAVSIPAAGTANFGSLAFSTTGAVGITEDSATQLSGASTAGSLALVSAGAITNGASSNVNVSGAADFTGTAITLGDTSSNVLNIGGTANFNASAGPITVLGAGSANFGSLAFNTSGAVSVSEGSDTNLAGSSTASSLTLASAGALTNAAGASLTVSGTASFNGSSISLGSQSGDAMNFGSLNYNSPGAVSISEDSSMAITGSNSAGSLLLAANGAITEIGTSQVVGGNASYTGTDITFIDSTGDVLTVGGTSNFTATSGSVMVNAGNVAAPGDTTFTGAISATAPGGVTIIASGTLISPTISAGTGSVSLDADAISGGSITASSLTLASDTPVTGMTLFNVSTLALSPGMAGSSFVTDTVPGTVSGPLPSFSQLTVPVIVIAPPPIVQDVITTTITTTTSASTESSSGSTSGSSPIATTSFDAGLAPSTSTSAFSIALAPTSTSTTTTTAPTPSATTTPADTSTTTAAASPTTTSAAPSDTSASTSTTPSDTSSTSTSSTTTSSTTATTTESSSTTSSEPTQTAAAPQSSSAQRSSGASTRSSFGTPTSAAAAQLVASATQIREQKGQAVENAVKILESNPAAADLKPCVGGRLADDCIATRPPEPARRGARLAPSVAHLPAIERKVALLIGVADYRGSIPKLGSPLKDVEEIGKIYREQFGYEVRTLANATKAGIVRELNRLILESGPNDSITVFYAGHGQVIEKTGRGYWIPGGASADDPTQWISNQDIGKALENIGAKQVLLVSDSCYSGTLTRDAKVQRTEILSDPAAVLARRSVTVLSSGGEEPVADAGKGGHSVFAWHFMQTLKNVQQWRNGIDVYEQLAGSVKQDFPQEPQYGAATGAGHQPGGDFLFEVRRY